MSLFAFFYFILSFILFILFFPVIILKSKNPKYKRALPARFFLKDNRSFENNGVWFHSCSMGETKSLKPIIDELSSDEVNISVITNTGYDEALKLSKSVRYLPFELFLPFWITKQKVLVVMEAELWFMLFYIAKLKKTKTILINARISDKSYHSYKKFSWFYKRIFANIDKVFAQSETDKQRLIEIGAKNVEVCGNIKLSQKIEATKKYTKSEETLIVAASTHKNEESLILDSYDRKLGKLVVVPRHPERFEDVDKLLREYSQKHNLSYHRFSKNENFDSDIVLVDKMGELINIFAISDVVILGGAFEKIGGHNPIEPAYFNNIIITGEHIFNQYTLFDSVSDYYIVKNDELKYTMKKIDKLEKAKLIDVGDINPILKEIDGKR